MSPKLLNKIDVEACHKNDARALRYAARLLRDNFQGDRESYRLFFGLRADAPALANIERFTL